MLLKKTNRFLLGILFTAVLASTANATFIENYEYELVLTSIDTDNPYGLSANDPVTLSIDYNTDNGVSGGVYSMHTLDNDEKFNITMVFGIDGPDSVARTYTALDDAYYWSPLVTFNTTELDDDDKWSIDTIDFYVVDYDLNYWIRIETEEINGPIVLTAGPVPEPGTFILLGFGLFSLAGLHRKRSLK